jgi:hypothetical protein
MFYENEDSVGKGLLSTWQVVGILLPGKSEKKYKNHFS